MHRVHGLVWLQPFCRRRQRSQARDTCVRVGRRVSSASTAMSRHCCDLAALIKRGLIRSVQMKEVGLDEAAKIRELFLTFPICRRYRQRPSVNRIGGSLDLSFDTSTILCQLRAIDTVCQNGRAQVQHRTDLEQGVLGFFRHPYPNHPL